MRKRSWTNEQLRIAASKSRSYREILLRLGLRMAGGNYKQIRRYLKEADLTPKLLGKGWSKGLRGIGVARLSLNDILKRGTSFQSFKLKKRLFSEGIKSPICEECGWARISDDGRLPLELDHINGDPTDNRLENLRILCPNCHSLKPTHRGLNKRKRSPARVAEWYTHDT
jgi:hypothetical protein